MTDGSSRRTWRTLLRVKRAARGGPARSHRSGRLDRRREPGPRGGAVRGDAADARPGSSALCSDPLPGYVACFAERRAQSMAASDPARLRLWSSSGYGPADIQSAYKLLDDARRRADGRDRRRLRPADRRGRSRRLPQPVRPAAVHDRQRLLPQDQPERRHDPAGRERRLGRRRSRSTSTWSRRPARSARSCWSRRTSPTIANLGTAVNQAVAAGRRRGLEQLRRLGELRRAELGHELLQARRRRDHRLER